ncbi:hypothetical protein ACFWA6_06765 [Streptomyces sp. NPDC060020]|uniref:hypothetical protein n=1 Tax=Streptomyces sp. NPDC060020 TaxID=3347038 RepID=UPI00367ED653
MAANALALAGIERGRDALKDPDELLGWDLDPEDCTGVFGVAEQMFLMPERQVITRLSSSRNR